MDFGRLDSLEGVDFGLAPIDAFGLFGPTSSGQRALAPQLHLGAPSWAKRRWVGRVYPEGTPANGYLAAYAQAYGAVELNATFYRTPTEDEARAWASSCPVEFRFAPKLPKTISQARKLVATSSELERYDAFARGLAERLGPTLLSLPQSFSTRELDALVAFLEGWPAPRPIAVEARHESWFRDRALVAPARVAFARLGVTAVITDVAGRRDVSHGTWTTPIAFVRFVGNALHATDYERIDAWASRLTELFARGLEQAYFFVHEPDDETTPELLSYAAERFENATGLAVKAPRIGPAKGQLALF